jgi:putative colanic acid biosynthesis acetyltransferase WcaF
MKKLDLSEYSRSGYNPGNFIRRALWYLTSVIFFRSLVPYPNSLKKFLLISFGAKLGEHINIKPGVNIKYPWFLKVGDYVWLGEGAWIDNLTTVEIADNVCISQGASVFTGNHNYKKVAFDLVVAPVVLEEGVWLAAKSVVCPGVVLKSHSVVTVGSVVTNSTQPYKIYQGNPAQIVGDRIIE